MGKRGHTELMTTMAKNADVLVHPSLEESFGNIFLEAGLQGKAIIAGKNSGAVPWVLGHGKAGVLINVRSIKQLENAMLYLAQNDIMRKRMGDQARKYVYENYSLDRMVDLYEEAYKKMVAIND
jgi:glycosyltransferase involved in cell wall biosynthesis